MDMKINMDQDVSKTTTIKVIGVGGGGGNAINRMSNSGLTSVELISVNTDSQSLRFSNATYKLHIGSKLTRGQGAGGNPVMGEKAAEESSDDITNMLRGTDMVYITAGMGGGTGTGATPVIARIAKELGILTVGIVTKPFEFEGKRRMQQAEEGIAKLRESVDALLVIPNERLRHISTDKITLFNAFVAADEVLTQAVQSISDLINIPGVINLDFADVTTVLKGAGYTHMGIGRATGKDKAEKAALAAISSPLLETSINGAKGVIVNFLTSPDVDLADINTASTMIHDAAHEDVNLIWGIAFDEKMEDEINIVVIATDFVDDGINPSYTPTVKSDIDAYELHASAQPKQEPEPENEPEPEQPAETAAPEPAYDEGPDIIARAPESIFTTHSDIPDDFFSVSPFKQPAPREPQRISTHTAAQEKPVGTVVPDDDEIDITTIVNILNNRLNSDQPTDGGASHSRPFFDNDDDNGFFFGKKDKP